MTCSEAKPTFIVYLDSSDFSDLSNPNGNLERALTIKNQLKDWSRNKHIEIRYSMTHVMEALPVDEKSVELAGLRIACIEELCGSNVMVDWLTLITDELSGQPPQQFVRDDAGWFPVSLVSNATDTQPDSKLNRQERRVLAAQLRKKKSGLDLKTERENLSSQFPLKPGNINQILKNPNNKKVLKDELSDSLADLQNVYDWHIAHHEDATEFSNLLRQGGREVCEIINEGSKQIRALYQVLVDQKMPEQRIDQALKNFANHISEELLKDMASSLAEDAKPPAQPVVANRENTPTLYVLSRLIAHHLKSSMLAIKQPRTPKESDFGDMFHAIYLPHVDFFRADAATAHGIRNERLGYQTEILTSLDKLMEVLKQKLCD